MIVSRSKRVLFVHVQRTGGTALGSLLLKRLPDAKSVGRPHGTMTEAKSLLGDDFATYFKFAFVRNPWDRVVSWWTLLREGSARGGSVPHRMTETLDAYLRVCRDAAAAATDGPLPFPSQQMDLLTDHDGLILADRLGRYERYAEDTRSICEHLNLTIEEIDRAGATRHGPYRDYYNAETRAAVAELYPRDVRELGYEF